jgi:hypothetical protein
MLTRTIANSIDSGMRKVPVVTASDLYVLHAMAGMAA